jgi:anti-anti-sigma regulatory factor
VIIVDLKGRVVQGPEDLALREHLRSLLDAGSTNVVLDLHSTSEIDTTGLGTLALFAEQFQSAGGKLVAVGPAKPSGNVALDTALDTFSDEQSAVNGFFPDRAVPYYDILEFVHEEEQRRHSESGGGESHE